MMSTIYLLRHGPTDSCDTAENNRQMNLPLSNWGVTETNLLRKWYDNGHSYPIYSSPAYCCRQSAEIIGGYKEKKSLISFVKDGTLNPITTLDELKDINRDTFRTESLEAAGNRLRKALVRIASREKEPCIVISHVDIIRAFLSEALQIPLQQAAQIPYPYLGITKLRFDGATFHFADSDAIGERPVAMLRQEEIAHFYHVLNTPSEHIRHMQAVSLYIDNLLTLLSKDLESPDAELIRAAALTYIADPRDSQRHGYSAHFLRINGYSAVADIIEGSDADTGTDTLTLSELLCYADNCIFHEQLTSLEERFFQEKNEKYERLKTVREKLYALF